MLVQDLKCFNGVGGAVRARIGLIARSAATMHQIVTLNDQQRVVELAEFPVAWGIWVCREWLMSSDTKAQGRTTRVYDATPVDTGHAARLYKELRDEEQPCGVRSPRLWWDQAYREARCWNSVRA